MAFEFLLVEDDPEIREIITDYFIEKSNGTFFVVLLIIMALSQQMGDNFMFFSKEMMPIAE